MTDNLVSIASHTREEIPEASDRLLPEASETFVRTPYIASLSERALAYLEAGFPVHLSGPAGTGKTTLAFHIAAQLDRPVTLIHGDDEFVSSDLVGRDSGYRKYKMVDNFVRSVHKSEERMNTYWTDNRLTSACEKGYTLIYDEFTRTRPEANNVLLSVLEEKILNLPRQRRSGQGYLHVHPDFRAIFTSNPDEYVGVHKTQDALMDRLITIRLDHFDLQTEIEIIVSKSGISRPDAEIIVDLVRELRQIGVNNHRPTIRACIAISRVLKHVGGSVSLEDSLFRQICRDVLNTDTAKVTRGGQSIIGERVDELLEYVITSKRESPTGQLEE